MDTREAHRELACARQQPTGGYGNVESDPAVRGAEPHLLDSRSRSGGIHWDTMPWISGHNASRISPVGSVRTTIRATSLSSHADFKSALHWISVPAAIETKSQCAVIVWVNLEVSNRPFWHREGRRRNSTEAIWCSVMGRRSPRWGLRYGLHRCPIAGRAGWRRRHVPRFFHPRPCRRSRP